MSSLSFTEPAPWSRRLLLLCLVLPPWFFATVHFWFHVFVAGLNLLTALVVLSTRPNPLRVPLVLALAAPAFLLAGIQLLNPVIPYFLGDPSGPMFTLVGGHSWLPCTIDRSATLFQFARWAAWLAGGLAYLQYPATRGDLRFFIGILVLNTAILSLVGTLHFYSKDPLILWFRQPNGPGMPFGPFIYRNNYVSYALLCLPYALGLCFLPAMNRRFQKEEIPRRLLQGMMLGLIVGGILTATARAAAILLPAAFIPFLALWLGLRDRPSSGFPLPSPGRRWVTWIRPALSLGIAAGFVFFLSEAWRSYARLEKMGILDESRLVVWQATWKAVSDAPLWGHGAGTFEKMFYFYEPQGVEKVTPFRWLDAHSDWLQTLHDFGWAGFILIALAITATFARLLWTIGRSSSPFARAVAGCTAIGMLLVLLHALVDFPFGCGAVPTAYLQAAAFGLAAPYAAQAAEQRS